MMANKQGKIQMYFYELLWLIQRLDNKKKTIGSIVGGGGDGLGADAHFPLSKMNGDELTHWVNVFPPLYNLRWPPYSAAIFDVVVIFLIVYSIAMLDDGEQGFVDRYTQMPKIEGNILFLLWSLL